MSKVAFLFPGQGAQYVGMGKEIYDNYDVARKTYEEASNALGFDVADLCFNGPQEVLNETKNTQPAILVTSIAMYNVLKEHIKPSMTAGLSLGEYSALICGGLLNFKDGIKLVQKRGELMQEAIPEGNWKMAAVLGMEESDVEKLCSDLSSDGFIAPANYNCPGQIVITAEESIMEKAKILAMERGAKRVLPLQTNAPFHTKQLLPASEKLFNELNKIEFNRMATCTVIKNLDATPYTLIDDMSDILAKHIINPVHFKQTIEYMLSKGIDTFIEIGPGKVLSGFVKKSSRNVTVMNMENIETFENILETLCNNK